MKTRFPWLVLVGVAAAALAGSAPSETSAPGWRVHCPRRALPLSGVNPIAPASRAALAREGSKSRPQVTGALFARDDTSRGPEAAAQCGAQARRRTIVVYVLRRAYLPSGSLSEGVFFVSRFRDGYRVWWIAH